MSTMCGVAQHNNLMRKIEKHLNDNAGAKRQDFIQVMTDTPSCAEALVRAGVLDSTADAKTILHLKVHWFGSDWRAWWPEKDARDEVLRLGFVQLLSPASGTLPVRIVWVCSGEYFQTILLKSNEQLTMIVLTPPIPNGVKLPAANQYEADITMVASLAEGAECVMSAAVNGGTPIKLGSVTGFAETCVIPVYSEGNDAADS